MSIISREKKPKGGGQSPQFKMRIDPALKEQLDAVAAEEGLAWAVACFPVRVRCDYFGFYSWSRLSIKRKSLF